MKRGQVFQFKHCRRVKDSLWRSRRIRQETLLIQILRKKIVESKKESIGKNTKKKNDTFEKELCLQRLICLLYGGLSKKMYKKTVFKAKQTKKSIASFFLGLLEKRLEIVLFRAGFTSSIQHSRQIINHKNVFVNGKSVSSPSYLLKSGDIFSIQGLKKTFIDTTSKDTAQINNSCETISSSNLITKKDSCLHNIYKMQQWKPIHLEINYAIKTGIFLFLPQEISYPTFFKLSDVSHLLYKTK